MANYYFAKARFSQFDFLALQIIFTIVQLSAETSRAAEQIAVVFLFLLWIFFVNKFILDLCRSLEPLKKMHIEEI
jgi:hypothetical protein